MSEALQCLTFLGLHLCGGHDSSCGCWGGYSSWGDHWPDACSWSGFVPWIDRLLAGCSHDRCWLNVGSWRLRCAGTDRDKDQDMNIDSKITCIQYKRYLDKSKQVFKEHPEL